MWTRHHKKKKYGRLVLPAVTIAFLSYFGYHSIHGDYGLRAGQEFERVRKERAAELDKLVAQQQIQRLYLFTELKGYAGQQLIHRWSFAGKVQTEALLTIEDSPWRTYSEKWLLPDQLGSWRVEIVDQAQKVLYQHDFQYQ